MIKISFVVLVILLQFNLAAQKGLDSLQGVWLDETEEDSNRVNAYREIIKKKYLVARPDTASVLTNDIIEFSQRQGYVRGEAIGLNLKGIALYYQGKYEEASVYYDSSLVISKHINDLRGVNFSLNNLALVEKVLGNYPKALDYHSKSLDIQKGIGDKKGVMSSYLTAGAIYKEQGDLAKALEYYQNSLKIAKEINNRKAIAGGLNNIGTIFMSKNDHTNALKYFTEALEIGEELGLTKEVSSNLNNIGLLYQKKDEPDKALEFYEKGFNLSKESKNKRQMAKFAGNIGMVYEKQEQYDKALEYFQAWWSFAEEIGHKYEMSSCLHKTGQVYFKMNNFSKALEKCQAGLKIAEEISNVKREMLNCHCLYEVHKQRSNGLKALEYHERYLDLASSLQSDETVRQLERMEFAKTMEADSIKEEEDKLKVKLIHEEEVRKKNITRNALLGGGVIFMIIAGSFFNRWKYVKKAKDVIEKEKDRSESLLLNILPEEIANELKEKGHAQARDFDQVSILFTDFKGFTQMSEKLTAKELVAEINHCFKAFDGICEKYGIEKIKTIGDAYMAAGGLPAPDGGSTVKVVLAALEMAAFVSKRKLERESSHELPFQMRAGIHTGNVVAGIVGVKKFQYDIWGDTVNMASRMESSGEVGKVNISKDTHAIIKDDPRFIFDYRGKIEAKGKGEKEMWFVRLA